MAVAGRRAGFAYTSGVPGFTPDVGSVRVLHFVRLPVFALYSPCCEVCYDFSL